MEAGEVIDILYRALRRCNDPRINDVTIDGSPDDCEVILTTDDGEQKQDWVFSSGTLVESDRDYDPQP